MINMFVNMTIVLNWIQEQLHIRPDCAVRGEKSFYVNANPEG